jgi:hypothetical protein
MERLALLFMVCMVVAMQYVIIAPSIMKVSLLLWLSFASLLLLFVVSLSIVVCRKSVIVVVYSKFICVVCHKFVFCYFS